MTQNVGIESCGADNKRLQEDIGKTHELGRLVADELWWTFLHFSGKNEKQMEG